MYTRSKLSNFTDKSTNCKLCNAFGEVKHEDIFHVFVECRRMGNFWERIENVFHKFDPTLTLSNENKLFGLIGPKGNKYYMYANIVIQTAQRAIWYSRRCYEENDLGVDLWDSISRKIQTLISRAYEIQETHRFYEIFDLSFFDDFLNRSD